MRDGDIGIPPGDMARLAVSCQQAANPVVGDLIVTVDAVGVDPQEHVNRVPGALGDRWSRDTGRRAAQSPGSDRRP